MGKVSFVNYPVDIQVKLTKRSSYDIYFKLQLKKLSQGIWNWNIFLYPFF